MAAQGLPKGGPNFISQGHPLIRLAGLSGAAAVALGAYGAHGKRDIAKIIVLEWG